MAMTSTILPLGTTAPPFDLPDVVTGQRYSLDSFTAKTGLLVMFICRHCPYVVHVDSFVTNSAVDGREQSFVGMPVKLRITAQGWRVNIQRHRLNKLVVVDVARVIKVIATGESDNRDTFTEADIADSSGEIPE